jgi:manganese transport protein
MQGFLHRQIPIFARRAITMIPALIVIGVGYNPSKALVLSQVFLSFGIPFALIPLLFFTSSRKLMGSLVNGRLVVVAASLVAMLIIGLNVYLLATA